jgi:hypothetical protein
MAGEQFSLGTGYLGLHAAALAQLVGVPCVGLLGADVLGRFDHIFDTAAARLTVSTAELSHPGQSVRVDEFRGIPIVTARVGGHDHRLFFDTGAQISYLQDESLRSFPSAGRATDFYPGVGQFQTDTHNVPVSLGGVAFTLLCGRLPGLLETTLLTAGTVGILGNEILRHRRVGYFPRRRAMVV